MTYVFVLCIVRTYVWNKNHLKIATGVQYVTKRIEHQLQFLGDFGEFFFYRLTNF